MNTIKIKHIVCCLNSFDLFIIWFKNALLGSECVYFGLFCCCLPSTHVANQEIDINDIVAIVGIWCYHKSSQITDETVQITIVYILVTPPLTKMCKKLLFRVHAHFRGPYSNEHSLMVMIEAQNFQQ